MQKEYWVNVYEYAFNSFGYGSALDKYSSDYMIEKSGSRVLYRIHVKLKNVKPKYEYGKIHESWFLY